MKKINSFKCSYCGKIYETKDSCRSHEYKCYFNPKTKSCASCGFLRFDSYYCKPNHSISVRTCMNNKDITRKMNTKCDLHFPKAELHSVLKVRIAENSYDPLPFVKEYLKGLEIESFDNIKVNSNRDSLIWIEEMEEEYNTFCAEAYIYKLAGAVGLRITINQEAKLTKDESQITDHELEKHSDFYIEEINDVLKIFSILNFKRHEILQIIERTAERIKTQISLPGLLITESEIAYNLKMVKALAIIDDEAGAHYFEQKANKLRQSMKIDKLFEKQFKATIPAETFVKLSKRYLTLFEDSISEIMPDLQQQIKTKLGIKPSENEYNCTSQEFKDVPF